MKALLFYLLQVIICSGLLYGYYHFFLRNKKFHQYNRYYLLLTVIASICIPFLQIPVYFDAAEAEPVFIKTLTIFSPGSFNEEFIVSGNVEKAEWFTWKNILSSLYIIAAVFLFVRFILSFLYIVRLTRIYPGEKIDNIRFINTDEPSSPFSFFRWLFWNRAIELNSDQGQQIFRHELFHIRQKHSWDIMALEIIALVFWVNPFFHLLKKEIKAIHEFLADRFAVQEDREWDYAELLLMQVLKSPGTRLTNPFFHNQIKRRIAMLTTSKKPGYQYLRKIMVLPMAAVVIALFAFSYKHKEAAKNSWSDEPITIVVDAAHGGTDPGAKSPDNAHTEAGLSLEIAKVIQTVAKEYNLKVVMTRESDILPGGAITKDEGLKNRMDITKKSNAWAFISIHLNSAVPGEKYQEKLSGIEAYVSNNRNDQKGKKLASYILNQLSSVYKTQQELKYRSQSGIWVLDQADCPAVLLECGFINNEKDIAFITDKANQEKIARSILEAVVAFKSKEFEIDAINADTIKPKSNSGEFSGTIEISTTGSVSTKEKSKLIVNGNEFDVKEIKIEGIEKTKIKAAEIHISNSFMTSGDTTDNPLIVIDGIKQSKNSGFEHIDPATIESINVYKGPTATIKYGSEGKNGVIEIIIKKNKRIIKQNPVKEQKLMTNQENNQQPGDVNLNNEIVVEGYASNKPGITDDSNKEVVAAGYPKNKENDNIIFEHSETKPSFPGGDAAWRQYLERNANSSVPVKNGAPAGVYKVLIQYIVKSDGAITEIKPLTNYGFGMETEAVRLIQNSPAWIPAMQNGKKVNAYQKQPIVFYVEDEKKPTRSSNELIPVIITKAGSG